MARPPKVGLSYFPVDVDWDDKLQSIELVFGNDGTKWILEFWKAAYKTNDGIVCFKEPLDLLFATRCKMSLDRHKEILSLARSIKFCSELDIGSEIYTSNGIQKRISQILKERREAKERKEAKERNKININGKEWVPCSAGKPNCSGEQSVITPNNQLSGRTTGEKNCSFDEPEPGTKEYIQCVEDEMKKAKGIISEKQKLLLDKITALKKENTDVEPS
jgi:hypothetical protein